MLTDVLGLAATFAVAAATIMMAVFTRRIHAVSKAAAAREERFQGQLSDLYTAIVVATLVGSPVPGSTLADQFRRFSNNYSGQTPILPPEY